MARPLRIEFAGALYHGMSGGNEQVDIVLDDGHRQTRLRCCQSRGSVRKALMGVDRHASRLRLDPRNLRERLASD